MCEEQPAVKALTFLQNEVANVVNHSDAKESDEFRSLMKCLLAPSANVGLGSRTSSTSTLRAGSTAGHTDPLLGVKNDSKKSHDNHDRDGQATESLNHRPRIFELNDGREEDRGDDDAEQEKEGESEDEDDCGWTNDISEFDKNVEGDGVVVRKQKMPSEGKKFLQD